MLLNRGTSSFPNNDSGAAQQPDIALLISVVSAGSSEGSGKPRNVEMSRNVHNQAGKVFPEIVPAAERECFSTYVRRSGLALRFCLILSTSPAIRQPQSAPRHSDSTPYNVWLAAPSLFPFSAQGSRRRRTLELSGNTKPSEGLPLAARDRHKAMITELSHFLHQWFLNRLQGAMPE